MQRWIEENKRSAPAQEISAAESADVPAQELESSAGLMESQQDDGTAEKEE